MKIFAVSDLHLSLSAPFSMEEPAQSYKPMTLFGDAWADFYQRLAQNWRDQVGGEDCVLLPGDISWAMQLAEARYDLAYIGDLPGMKVMIKGNHDYWWASIGRLRQMLPPHFIALQHNAIAAGRFAVCGTRGWLLPCHNDFNEQEDRKIFDRELLRLEMALEEAQLLQRRMIVLLHFPPLDELGQETAFMDLICRYPVDYCLYGHIHGNKNPAFAGEYRGVQLINCSVDRLGCRPLLITEG
ncbi:MAG: metallophosphoesterase [Clostridiales bacterium]